MIHPSPESGEERVPGSHRETGVSRVEIERSHIYISFRSNTKQLPLSKRCSVINSKHSLSLLTTQAMSEPMSFPEECNCATCNKRMTHQVLMTFCCGTSHCGACLPPNVQKCPKCSKETPQVVPNVALLSLIRNYSAYNQQRSQALKAATDLAAFKEHLKTQLKWVVNTNIPQDIQLQVLTAAFHAMHAPANQPHDFRHATSTAFRALDLFKEINVFVVPKTTSAENSGAKHQMFGQTSATNVLHLETQRVILFAVLTAK